MKHRFARKLRRDQTDVERKLWTALRGRQFAGFKFRRQQPVGPYIADFLCFETRLIIELDGDQHGSEPRAAYDKARTQWLQKDGFEVLRFSNHEANSNFADVLESIGKRLAERTPHPPHSLRNAAPSPTRGEGKSVPSKGPMRTKRQPRSILRPA